MGTIISIIAIVLSGLSFISSIVCYVISYYQNKKINNINMNARLYNTIFDDFLIEKIPRARKYLRFENNKLVDSENLCDVLTDLRNKILYFRYANKKFYVNLCEQIDNIEDYVSECGNKESIQEEQGKVFEQIQEKLEKLYTSINENYVGKYRIHT